MNRQSSVVQARFERSPTSEIHGGNPTFRSVNQAMPRVIAQGNRFFQWWDSRFHRFERSATSQIHGGTLKTCPALPSAMSTQRFPCVIAFLTLILLSAEAQEKQKPLIAKSSNLSSALSAGDWTRVETSIDRV